MSSPSATSPATAKRPAPKRRDVNERAEPKFEQQLLYGDLAETIGALLRSQGLTQKDLAERLGRSESWISRVLGANSNTTLKTIAELGWALGIRFNITATPLPDRHRTPAANDPPPPDWLESPRERPSASGRRAIV